MAIVVGLARRHSAPGEILLQGPHVCCAVPLPQFDLCQGMFYSCNDRSAPRQAFLLLRPRSTSVSRLWLALLREEDGPTAVEYAALLAVIFLAVVGAVAAVGQQAGNMFQNATEELSNHGL